jgi:DNA-binding transcriptional ArsR family regulator
LDSELDGREFKDAVFEQFARIAAAFASPKRIELIDILAQGERNVESLAKEAHLSMANTSSHLRVLKTAGLVVSRKKGLQVLYRVSDATVLTGYRAFR